ncbi:endonuclease/exonuclease/phosphatase family protein [Novosphingobium malaysiense]|uniref:Endonuclease/exonuclease/phosphatase domain-containing protein n=1 Tax=Novosphingobium malaysiense TaxID=1348853 RepID=A0A0B1ZSZ5_9SPHN|nr:endonuclease/exonuclease/phosphatase family protein [Novosphingobium malaysiense]KHK92237.1 hypothetical protein LK12_05130 [Novosphingobium malaysiense]
MNKLAVAVCGLAAITLLATLVSLIPSDAWFIRPVDMVRELLVYAAAVVLVLAIVAGSRLRWITVFMLGLVAAINIWRVWPYWSIAGQELQLADSRAHAPTCFTAMAANVKVKNKDYGRIAAQVRQYDPDVLFLMETDRTWIDRLDALLAGYPFVRRHPQPKGFGLVFATRLPVAGINLVENTYRDTPTLYATLQPSGFPPVEFIGLHPKPPLPGWNTQLRDRSIVRAGIRTPDRLPDAFVTGDFNDVPWSRTTTKFRETGGWKDPRIGRGSYPTFPAGLVPIGWPLDQLMLKGNIELNAFEVLPDNGSDHRAMFARICPSHRQASQ